ncbi:phasin protein [Albidovulum inexpectatum]|uniref:Phasin protein n=1 Tax=Albidovulum inexpectatum TaxID=196587 RepID=A0A2S5JKC5_9RHOB|nr:phasin family protein [Albidovulum inexpectatum]PPB81883.1 phasin protein [Albidovulum inexpectatum]
MPEHPKAKMPGMPDFADVMAFYTALFEGMGEIGTELMQFVSNRLALDLATQQQMLGCTDPAKLMQIHLDFLQRAFEDYAEETGKVVNIGNRVMHDALERHLHKRDKDNTPI